MRDQQVANGVAFLTHPNAANVAEEQLVSFLKNKGLTQEEITEAQRQAKAKASGAAAAPAPAPAPPPAAVATTTAPVAQPQGTVMVPAGTQMIRPQSIQIRGWPLPCTSAPASGRSCAFSLCRAAAVGASGRPFREYS